MVIFDVPTVWFFINLFIYLFLAVLGLRFCARAFSSCGKRGPLFIAESGPLTVAASPVAEHRLRRAGSVVVAHELSCSAACGILPDQGSNPCPPHWQADSQPLRHQGSPDCLVFVAKLYILAPLLLLWSSPSELSERPSSRLSLRKFRQINHNSQLLGCAFFSVHTYLL